MNEKLNMKDALKNYMHPQLKDKIKEAEENNKETVDMGEGKLLPLKMAKSLLFIFEAGIKQFTKENK
jgi:hypothetical protein